MITNIFEDSNFFMEEMKYGKSRIITPKNPQPNAEYPCPPVIIPSGTNKITDEIENGMMERRRSETIPIVLLSILVFRKSTINIP